MTIFFILLPAAACESPAVHRREPTILFRSLNFYFVTEFQSGQFSRTIERTENRVAQNSHTHTHAHAHTHLKPEKEEDVGCRCDARLN